MCSRRKLRLGCRSHFLWVIQFVCYLPGSQGLCNGRAWRKCRWVSLKIISPKNCGVLGTRFQRQIPSSDRDNCGVLETECHSPIVKILKNRFLNVLWPMVALLWNVQPPPKAKLVFNVDWNLFYWLRWNGFQGIPSYIPILKDVLKTSSLSKLCRHRLSVSWFIAHYGRIHFCWYVKLCWFRPISLSVIFSNINLTDKIIIIKMTSPLVSIFIALLSNGASSVPCTCLGIEEVEHGWLRYQLVPLHMIRDLYTGCYSNTGWTF